MTTDMGTVVQMPTSNYTPKIIHPSKVFLHRTEGGTAAGAAAWLCRPATRAGVHLVSDGTGGLTFQLTPLQYESWGQCSFNPEGLSIEYPGYTAEGVPDALARVMARDTSWLLRAYGLPCQHAAGGKGAGYCMHNDLGAAGGGHTDICGVEDATWNRLEGFIKEAYDAFGSGPLPTWALHGLPNPHQVELPPSVTPTPSHLGAARIDPASAIVPHPTASTYPRGSVADLQWRLIKAGYSVGPDGVDGFVGDNTRDAILAFQQAHGLAGAAWPIVSVALYSATSP